jgi:RNA polymerase sigma-70 factor (ECF subfamily)
VDRADVDDQVQEVFVIAHRKGGYVAGPAAPSTWLAAIAVRVASHYRRGRGRRREAADDRIDATASSGVSPERALELARSVERVREALAGVDVGHRAVFVLFEIEHRSCEEIARALDIPVGTVHSRLHTARAKFREAHARLQREEDAS